MLQYVYIYIQLYTYIWLVYTHPSEKWWSSSVGIIIPKYSQLIWKVIQNSMVPNISSHHQPAKKKFPACSCSSAWSPPKSARLLDAAGPVADLDPIRFDLGVEALEAVWLPFVHEHRDETRDETMVRRDRDDELIWLCRCCMINGIYIWIYTINMILYMDLSWFISMRLECGGDPHYRRVFFPVPQCLCHPIEIFQWIIQDFSNDASPEKWCSLPWDRRSSFQNHFSMFLHLSTSNQTLSDINRNSEWRTIDVFCAACCTVPISHRIDRRPNGQGHSPKHWLHLKPKWGHETHAGSWQRTTHLTARHTKWSLETKWWNLIMHCWCPK